ncbi:MAG: redoxin domain-containing protein [Nitrospiraceae bacterium]
MTRIANRKAVGLAACGLAVAALLSVISQVADGRVGMPAPEITNEIWLNSPPQRLVDLRGKVVLVEFWTFGCYNCRNVEPYVKDWHGKYAAQGLVVIGVHSPEFKYEHNVEKVKQYLREHEIRYAVAIDNDFAAWNRFGNRYWPAMYVIDKQGVIRAVRIGEGGYQETERLIRTLLTEDAQSG